MARDAEELPLGPADELAEADVELASALVGGARPDFQEPHSRSNISLKSAWAMLLAGLKTGYPSAPSRLTALLTNVSRSAGISPRRRRQRRMLK